ncbi:hypothetical protein FSARC_1077 [Fusarium sarcochroum]|uniref:Anaphase-promoting complex subunit 4-like WD40 domain-containing protein n=1 Tax=Fusarium sarcochroum TaxID=1208366 RepID=A0A8H4UA19_9HYPO|nr:hypothetical protein FSARC_1077 [Fusarium sarcochroum]
MPSYSSDEFLRDWRYAVAEDLTTSLGEPYPYAHNGQLQWGNELKKMTFKKQPHLGSVSSDGTRLALAVKCDIHIIDTKSWDTIVLLKGHTSKIDSIVFKPDDANILVSSGDQEYDDRDEIEPPTIIVWNIEKEQAAVGIEDESLKDAARSAASAAVDRLAKLGIGLDSDGLGVAFEPVINHAIAKHLAADKKTIHGRLHLSFHSQIFSPSGKWMSYLPGKAPPSNGNAPWDIQIISADDLKENFLLRGHTDAVMWAGWSPDETLFASVAWDCSIRIWDATTGQEKHRFETKGQNWTGAFTADSRYFAATDGTGNVWVYSLSDGVVYWVYEATPSDGWRRTIHWHPNGKWLAVGGEQSGELLLLDVEEKKLIQKRLLSVDACTREEEVRNMMKSFVGTEEVKFVDGGNKLAVWTLGDWSIEVYDINQQVKWRFARGGTDDGPEASKWRDEEGKVTSGGSYDMLVWEDPSKGQLVLASLDFDGVRIWGVPLTL